MHNVQDNIVLYNNSYMTFYSHVENTCMISSFHYQGKFVPIKLV
jgi:hypothetical protein